jgi:hypothetical protein
MSSSFQDFFISFVQILDKYNINYCILRGYEELPLDYSNDLDLGIHPSDKGKFFECLEDFKISKHATFLLRDSRYEVLKITAVTGDVYVDLDFWFGFNYVGLKYMDINEMMSNYLSIRGFKVLNVEDELTLSFLKELLHNNIMRHDKVDVLNQKLINSNLQYIAVLFSKSIRYQIVKAIQEHDYNLKVLSYRVKLFLFFNNTTPSKVLGLLVDSTKFILFRLFPSLNPLVSNMSKIINVRVHSNIL